MLIQSWLRSEYTEAVWGVRERVPLCRRFLDLCSDHRLIERRLIDIISRDASCEEANIKALTRRCLVSFRRAVVASDLRLSIEPLYLVCESAFQQLEPGRVAQGKCDMRKISKEAEKRNWAALEKLVDARDDMAMEVMREVFARLAGLTFRRVRCVQQRSAATSS